MPKMTVIDRHRWVPRENGPFYGSDGCCHALLCTRAAFDQATREAAELVAHLGPGWEPVVWENLGWHYKATLTSGDLVLTVHSNTRGSNTRGGWTIRGYGAQFSGAMSVSADGKTPEAAVIAVIEVIRTQYESLGEVLASTRKLTQREQLSEPLPRTPRDRGGETC